MRLLGPKAGSCAFPAVVGWRKQASSTTPQDAPRDGERIPAGHGMALSHEALSKHVISNEHHLRPLYPKGSFIASAFYNFHIFASINAIEACQQTVA